MISMNAIGRAAREPGYKNDSPNNTAQGITRHASHPPTAGP
jgi:hypothetical protein